MTLRIALVALVATAAPAADLAAGRRIFEAQCALCHGQNAGGGRGPSLRKPVLDRAPDDAALTRIIEQGIEPEMPGAWQLTPNEVASVVAFLKIIGTHPPEQVPGDASKGAAIYRARGCAGCHVVAGAGSGFGPELNDVGARRNAAHLAESIVKPAAHLPDRFLMLEAGNIRGIRVNEDTFSIQLRDASGKTYSFDKAIPIRRLTGQTPMPGYSLPADELTDLIKYLTTLRGRR